MILVDTSVWVDHLRHGTVGLDSLLKDGYVLCHPFIIGELACGNLRNRAEILSLLKTLPTVLLAEDEEVMRLIDNFHLMGKGLGYIDMHLLASATLNKALLWTFDKRLQETSLKLGLSR